MLASRSPADFPIPDSLYAETVTAVEHYTNDLFRFRVTRPQGLRFRSGEFVMLGLPNSANPVLRAYSIASPSWDDELEFFSIKVLNGALTENLQNIAVGDTVIMRRKSTGTLVNDALIDGQRLFMFSTGTGIAPFASLIRDPETFEKFDEVILTQTCRTVAELKYGYQLFEQIKNEPLIGEFGKGKVLHYASATRECGGRNRRITDLLKSGQLFDELQIPPIMPQTDRAMICGSKNMLKETSAILENLGLMEGSNSRPQTYVIERAFVD